MFCIHCGAKLSESARFCDRCGTPVGQQPAQPAAGQAVAPAWGQPVYPCFFYPVNAVPAAPGAAPAAAAAEPAPQGQPVPIYRKGKPTAQPEDVPATEEEDTEEPVQAPEKESDLCPLSVWHTLLCYLALFCLPIGNIIFACVWGFRADEHPQRRNMARAALPLIAAFLLVLFCALLWVTANLGSISFTLR